MIEVIENHPVDILCLSEHNIFQYDLKTTLNHLGNKFMMFLNSDDLHEPEVAMVKSRIVGGTLLIWAAYLDPYVTIHPPTTSSFTALILNMPGYITTIHVVIYMPTSGKENEFITELSNLRLCLTELSEQYPGAAIFIRGDGNVNKNNKNRALIFNQFLKHFSLTHVDIQHNTYHHFLGDGLYDSDIDVILHTPVAGISECVTGIRCKLIHTDMLSHHDMVMSRCTVPPSTTRLISNEKLVTAPRLQNNRAKITWSTDGTVQYMNLITPILKSLRETWLHSCST